MLPDPDGERPTVDSNRQPPPQEDAPAAARDAADALKRDLRDRARPPSVLRRDRLDHLLAYIEARPPLTALTNFGLNAFFALKEGTKKLVGYRSPPALPGATDEAEDQDGDDRYKKPLHVVAVSPEDPAYRTWYAYHGPRPDDLKRMALTVPWMPYRPLISIVMPTYNTPERFLREAIASVQAQVYPHWELCVADDASTEPHVRAVLDDFAAADSRIKTVYREENGHISRSSNSALAIATGEFVALLDHDDLLTPDALYEVVLLLNQHPEADAIYSDEDKIDENNYCRHPFFKPDWSPDSFLSRMYTCHLGVYRRSILTAIGGFRPGYEGSQDYDLVLRFVEQTDRVFHIPKVLYHWRIHDLSAASGTDAKPYAYEAAKKALAEALERRGEAGRVEGVPDFPGHYIIRYPIADPKRVSIIIPTRDLGDLLDRCLASIFTLTTYPDYEVVVVDNGSTDADTFAVFDKWRKKEGDRFRCERLDVPFNFSQLNNFGVDRATGDYLLFLNNDTEVITPDWLEAMVEQAQRPSIGAVGALLLYPDGAVQHAGVLMGLGGIAAHSHRGFGPGEPGYFGHLISTSNVAAVTGACLLCRRSDFEAVGRFDETLSVAYNDVDLCLRFLERGLRNIYLPHAKLYHYESKSRGYEDDDLKRQRWLREAMVMVDRWQSWIDNDPYYSPNLTRSTEDYRVIDETPEYEKPEALQRYFPQLFES